MNALNHYGQKTIKHNSNKVKQLLLAVAVVFSLTSTSYANYADFQALLPSGSEMGFVLATTDGEIIASHNAGKLMAPASTLKLLTASAAWLELGEDFRFKTRIFTGEVVSGVADGDLVLQMSGDPTFSRADLYRLLQQLKDKGIHTIKGKLVFDDQLFYGYDRARGWPWDDLGVCFSAPVSTTMLDGNCVNVRLEPKGGEMIVSKPSHIPLDVTSFVEYAPISMMCPLELEMDELHYTIRGCADQAIPLALAVDKPKRYTEAVIQQQLAELGIRLLNLDNQQLQITSQVAEHQSMPLQQLLVRVLQRSDNLISDSLLRHLGVQRYQVGSFQAGVAAMNDILEEEMLLEFAHSDLFDGSGLSRYNLTTPAVLANVLQHWQSDPRLQPLVALLPVAGQSGTLRNRPGTLGVSRQLAAKSGSFDQVVNLAGFLTTKQQQTLVVVQMVSGINSNHINSEQQLIEFEQALYNCIYHRCFQAQPGPVLEQQPSTGGEQKKEPDPEQGLAPSENTNALASILDNHD